jgi:ABC-type nitrate/sulfonate/bicarbonate transport system substrate-binding protein
MTPVRIAVPDMISNSYFPVLAARELDFLRLQGLDGDLVLMSPADKGYGALAAGEVDIVAAEAHAALAVFPDFRGMKFVCAQSQGMYWFLVMRSDLGARRGDLACVRGRRIGASPWVDLGLKRMLAAAGVDVARDGVAIAPIPGGLDLKVSTGVTAAKALEDGVIDGFWANGMGAQVAVERGVGTIVIDARRGDGPPGAFDYTFPAVAATDRLLDDSLAVATGVVRAVVAAQAALRNDVSLAAIVARSLFPPAQAALIEPLIARDLPFYDASISRSGAAALCRFAVDVGLLAQEPSYQDVVAVQFEPLWRP